MAWQLPLWDHQKRAARGWAQTLPRDSLQIITPGGGKTRLGLAIAYGALEGGLARQLLIAVPTRPLKLQWQLAAAEAGILLDDNFDGRLRRGALGGIVTYAQMLEQPDVLERYVQRAPTFVTNDEPHHLGFVSSWGTAAERIEYNAPHRLHLTGTPIRTKKKDRIAMLRYDQSTGEAVSDFRYDYRDALRDRVVRALVPHPQGAQVRWVTADGKERQATFEDRHLSKKHVSERLYAVLTHEGYIGEVIARADATLQGLRKRDPLAGGLAIGISIRHAETIAKIITELTGVRPPLVLGDDPSADEAIHRFKHSTDGWIVAVQKVAEGVDIPRLRVLAYLTNRTTELWWRQVNGRIVRSGKVDGPGYVLFPSDPRLLYLAELLAEDVRAAQDIWNPLKPKLELPETEEEEEHDADEDDDPSAPSIVPLEVKHQSADAWTIGTTDPYALELTNTNESAQNETIALLHQRSEDRATYNQLVRQLAARSSHSPHDIHAWWKRKQRHGVDEATDDEMTERIAFMRSWLTKGHFPSFERVQRRAAKAHR